ncbi:ferritin [Synechococcus sp. M16CYN]|uniref:ferritin n=1 Tax=Synechococcus sp. M16CYN TaxID=3103139 RepID=UPI0030E2262E
MTSVTTSQFGINAVNTGFSGRAVAEPMAEDLFNGLQHHLNMERQAHTNYFAAAIWFAERELKGFSKYFREESQTEHGHAAQFAEYLIARGQIVKLLSLEAPKQLWESPVDILASSFLMEADITASLHQLYALGEQVSDMRTTVFLDSMIDQQTQAENEFAYLLGRVKFARNEAPALLIIDNELYQGQHQPAVLKS